MGKGKRKNRHGKAASIPSCSTTVACNCTSTDLQEPVLPLDEHLARAPFNIPHLDTVAILTRDKIKFFANKSLLLLASTHFTELLSSRVLEPDNDEVLDCPIKSDSFDAMLRFLYPIKAPVFADTSEPHSNDDTLPYKMMATIHSDAKILGIDYVCALIRESAERLAFSQLAPTSSIAAIRVYAATCALHLDYNFKLGAASACLRLPMKFNLHEVLMEEGTSKENIVAFEEYYTRCYEAVYSFLQVNAEDAHADGLPDAYSAFVSCSECNGASDTDDIAHLMRPRAAQWWQDYVRRAIEKLYYAPLDPVIFSEQFVQKTFAYAKGCPSCTKTVHWKWCQIMPILVRGILERIRAVRIPSCVSTNIFSCDHGHSRLACKHLLNSSSRQRRQCLSQLIRNRKLSNS